MLFSYPTQQFGGGVVLGIADDFDATAVGQYLIALRHILAGVVSSLHLDVRLDLANQGANIGLIEDHDGVDAFESGDDFSALQLRHGRTSGAFVEAVHALVRVDGDDESSAQSLGS